VHDCGPRARACAVCSWMQLHAQQQVISEQGAALARLTDCRCVDAHHGATIDGSASRFAAAVASNSTEDPAADAPAPLGSTDSPGTHGHSRVLSCECDLGKDYEYKGTDKFCFAPPSSRYCIGTPTGCCREHGCACVSEAEGQESQEGTRQDSQEAAERRFGVAAGTLLSCLRGCASLHYSQYACRVSTHSMPAE
jgi:hypothetical protein